MPKKITAAIIVVFSFYLLSPFLDSVGMGAIFAVLFYPLMKRIDRGRFPNAIAAGLFTLGVTLLLFLPVSTLMIVGVKSGLSELRQIKRQIPMTETSTSEVMLDKIFTGSGFDSFLVRTAKVLPINPEQVSGQLKDVASSLIGRVGEALSHFVVRIPNMMVAFTVFLFAIYYFLADGVQFLHEIRKRSFFTQAETNRLFAAFSGLCRSVILASVITGGVQALLITIVSFIVNVPQSLLLFPIVFVASFVPLIGAFPLIIGVALYHLFTGHTIGGLVLIAAAIFTATIDNVIRPQILRGGSNMHPLLGFVSVLGGLELFGMSGLFLGPVVCGMMVEIVKVVQDEKKTELHEANFS